MEKNYSSSTLISGVVAFVGQLFLGGKDEDPVSKEIYPSGICFFLNRVAKTDKIRMDIADGWDVEIKKGYDLIVARSRKQYSYDELLSQGYEQCQQFLDLLSVFNHDAYLIRDAGYRHICQFPDSGRNIIRYVTIENIRIGGSARAQVVDKNGNVIEQPEVKPEWIQAFRYYRLSQTSEDCYEAYRNLFLSFESLLDWVNPYSRPLREKDWILKTAESIHEKYSLSSEVPPDWEDAPANYIVDRLYSKIRCGLFHSKDINRIIPQSDPNPSEIINSYHFLIKLWRKIAEQCLKIRITGGGVTNYGFQTMIRSLLPILTDFSVTEDPSPDYKDDTLMSPLGLTVYPGKVISINEQYGPGLGLAIGVIDADKIPIDVTLHRIGFGSKEQVAAVNLIKEGINLIGTDTFEYHLFFHLVNINSPKVPIT